MNIVRFVCIASAIWFGSIVGGELWPNSVRPLQAVEQQEQPATEAPATALTTTTPAWDVLATSAGPIRLNRFTGKSYLLIQPGNTDPEWLEIRENFRPRVAREKRMIEAVRKNVTYRVIEGKKGELVVDDDALIGEFGLFKGDVILTIDGKVATQIENMISEAWHGDAGRTVLRVRRNGGDFDLFVKSID